MGRSSWVGFTLEHMDMGAVDTPWGRNMECSLSSIRGCDLINSINFSISILGNTWLGSRQDSWGAGRRCLQFTTIALRYSYPLYISELYMMALRS